MLKPELMSHVVARLRALADENRIRLLMRLKEGECNVSQLTQELGLAQASVSKHLSVLRQAGLIEVSRRGTSAYYRIHDDSVFEMCQIVCDGVIRRLQSQHSILRLVEAGGEDDSEARQAG
jgi:DNA-binding transcriptional ArsR family regulator